MAKRIKRKSKRFIKRKKINTIKKRKFNKKKRTYKKNNIDTIYTRKSRFRKQIRHVGGAAAVSGPEPEPEPEFAKTEELPDIDHEGRFYEEEECPICLKNIHNNTNKVLTI